MVHITDEEVATLTTIEEWRQNIPQTVYELGGTHCRVEAEAECHTVQVYTDLGQYKQQILLDWISERRRAGVKVNIYHETKHEHERSEDNDMLTDAELYDVLGALPDDCSDGIDVGAIDMQTMKPYIDKYGGLPEVLDAVERSVDTTDSGTQESWAVGNGSPSRETETPQQTIERLCDEYVSGEIETVLELEDELDEPVESYLESESLLLTRSMVEV